MRNSLVTGTALAVAAGVVVVLGESFDLDLESTALLGGAMGAVVAMVPHRSPLIRMGGFAVGVVVAWIGYAVRAAFLPDTTSGRAVAASVVVLVCTVVAAASQDRVPLWPLLLGLGTFAGAYEFTYGQAPTELVQTSSSTATTLFLTVAVGFFVGSMLPQYEVPGRAHRRRLGSMVDEPRSAKLDDLMKADEQ